uniref:Uncharacterized protein n=1 Tax=Setaria italica TaxID=4555 RepID=K3ZCK6_SETIT
MTTSVNKIAVVVCFRPFGSKSLWTNPFFSLGCRFLGYSFKLTFWCCQCRFGFSD